MGNGVFYAPPCKEQPTGKVEKWRAMVRTTQRTTIVEKESWYEARNAAAIELRVQPQDLDVTRAEPLPKKRKGKAQ